MDRRDLLTAGGALALAGLVGVAKTSSAHAAETQTTPYSALITVFDFGAVGDGVTDDSAAIEQALQWAMDEKQVVYLPTGTYAVRKQIRVVSKHHVDRRWGMVGDGTIVAEHTDDVLVIESRHVVRYLRLAGFGIKGNRNGSGCGILLNGIRGLYACDLSGLVVEGAGKHGIYLLGGVFETTLSACTTYDCNHTGIVLSHSEDGDCSSIVVRDCQSSQNLKFGLLATGTPNTWRAAFDVRVMGGYYRDNGGYGAVFHGGMIQGAAMIGVGFENNCNEQHGWNGIYNAHVMVRYRGYFVDCFGHDFEHGNCRYFVRGQSIREDCVLERVAKRCTGPARDRGYKDLMLIAEASGSPRIKTKDCFGEVVDLSGNCEIVDRS